MPYAPPRPCRNPGCKNKTTARHGYCDSHLAAARLEYDRDRQYDPERAVYRSRRWTKLSQQKRLASPICEVCEREGRVTPADMVHHKVPIADGGEPYEWTNLESICRQCHAKVEEHKLYQRRRPLNPYEKRQKVVSEGLDIRCD